MIHGRVFIRANQNQNSQNSHSRVKTRFNKQCADNKICTIMWVSINLTVHSNLFVGHFLWEWIPLTLWLLTYKSNKEIGFIASYCMLYDIPANVLAMITLLLVFKLYKSGWVILRKQVQPRDVCTETTFFFPLNERKTSGEWLLTAEPWAFTGFHSLTVPVMQVLSPVV